MLSLLNYPRQLNTAKLATLVIKDKKKVKLDTLNGILTLSTCYPVGLTLLHRSSTNYTMCFVFLVWDFATHLLSVTLQAPLIPKPVVAAPHLSYLPGWPVRNVPSGRCEYTEQWKIPFLALCVADSLPSGVLVDIDTHEHPCLRARKRRESGSGGATGSGGQEGIQNSQTSSMK